MRCAETTCFSYGTCERVQRLGRVAHRLPIGAGAHDQAHERLAGHRRLRLDLARERFTSSVDTERAVRRASASSSSFAAIPSRSLIVSGTGDPFFRQTIASRRTATFGSRAASSCSSGRKLVHVTRVVARERLQRDQRRAAHARALVVETATQQLDLLAEAELRQRPEGQRAHAIVGVACRSLDLVAPFAPQGRELLLEPARAVLLRELGGLIQGQLGHGGLRTTRARAGPGPT